MSAARPRRAFLLAFSLAALAWAGAAAAQPAARPATTRPPAALADTAAGAARAAPARARSPGARPVELRAGDVVKLYVWREPDFSRDYEVDGDGRVTLPKLGPVRVAGLAPDSLKALLEARYARSLRDPSIEVSLRRRISVLGAVRTPGILLVDPYTTVTEALAMAGGPTTDARTDYVRVRRGARLLPTRISTSTPVADAVVQSGDQLYVPDRGWMSRNLGVVSAATSAAGMLLLAVRRR